jgi:hypothetical protein
MSNIPSKADLADAAAAKAARAALQQIEDDVKFFTDEIVKAMKSGESDYEDRTRNVSPEALARLQEDFAPNWTLSVRNHRTGCYITWA